MSFGTVAGDYDRLRPQPPETTVGWLLPGHHEVAVDLAAGTGLLSRVLARQVPSVIAVEPDERMAAVLRSRSPGVRVVRGQGEAIPLADASADGVFISSAWHWLDPARAIPEIARVLRDGGRFGVLWTGRDRDAGWWRELRRPRPDDEEATSQDAAGARGPAGAGGAGPRRSSRRREPEVSGTGLFGQPVTASFRFTRTMTISAIVGMQATYSRIITASPDERAAELHRVRALLEERFPGGGEIEVPMRAWCWRADRAGRAEQTGQAGRAAGAAGN
jgi:SAM-dependent methyltransferase